MVWIYIGLPWAQHPRNAFEGWRSRRADDGTVHLDTPFGASARFDVASDGRLHLKAHDTLTRDARDAMAIVERWLAHHGRLGPTACA